LQSRPRRSGFSLLEVLLAISILALSLLYLTPAFIRSMSILSRLRDEGPARLALTQVLTDAEIHFRKNRRLEGWPFEGDVRAAGRTFTYDARATSENTQKSLYRLNVVIRYGKGEKQKISGVGYVLL